MNVEPSSLDDLDDTEHQRRAAGLAIEHCPTDGPWGVRRVCIHDLLGNLVNILMHK